MKNRTFSKDFWIYLSIFIAIIILICFFPSLFTEPGRLDFKDKGEIGDTIGGTMGPFVAIAAALLTFLAFWVQYKANEQQRKDIAIERFESNLFALIHLQQEIVNALYLKNGNEEIRQRNVFERIYTDARFEGRYNSLPVGLKSIIETEGVEACSLVSEVGCLDHYFRHLYRIFKYIDDSKLITHKEKYNYTSIVRANLSQYELIMLFYNCLSENGNEKFKPIVEKYALFNNIRTDLLARERDQYLYALKFKPEYTFEDDKNITLFLEYKKGAFVYREAD